MKVKFNYAPGQEVKDIFSGLTGKITASVLLLEGYTQFQVQPQSKDGNDLPDAWAVDENHLELNGTNTTNFKLKFEAEFKYNLGSKAEDIVTGLKGTLTKAIYHINGCIYYRIQPKGKGEKILAPAYVHESLIKILKKVKEPILEEDPPKGPSERIAQNQL